MSVLEGWLSKAAAIGMAVGPPLVYADQAYSIVKKRHVVLNKFIIHTCVIVQLPVRDSAGFSRDVCGIL